MRKEKKYFQLIPEKVFAELDTISEKLRPGIKGYDIDNLKQIISIIATHIKKSDGLATLKILYLRRFVPSADLYLRGLIDLEIVNRSGFAKIGITSFKYSFTEYYLSKYVSIPMKNAKLILRIEEASKFLKKECSKTTRNRKDQVKCLKQLTISSDYMEYLNFYSNDTVRYNLIKSAIARLEMGDIRTTVDPTSGRFHSIITNMPKGLRPYLRVRNESLVNIDVKCCQPYLSTIILTNPSKVSFLTKNTAFALLLKNLKTPVYKEDVQKYISLVREGIFYEFLTKEFEKEGLILSRDETKKQVYRILYGRNRLPKNEINKQARLVFEEIFPTVHGIFTKIRGNQKGDKFLNYKRFSILLQSIESYLILDVILKRIYRELPGVAAMTIHDSIMTTGILTNNVESVTKIMKEEFYLFIGFQPILKIENLHKKEI